MFDSKAYFCFFRKAALFLILSGSFAFSETTFPVLLPPSESEESAFGEFLKKNLHVTPFGFDRSIGTVDLFMMGEKHHGWWHVGAFGRDALLGTGFGYRYLIKSDYAYQDWFVGGYGYGRWTSSASRHRFQCNAGLEAATAHSQWTLNGYNVKSYPRKENESINYKEGDIGVSLRASSYSWQTMTTLGRVNLFGFGALTRVKGMQDNQALKPQWMWNTGFGPRWEFPYIAFELRLVWKQNEGSWPKPEGGVQIHGPGQKNREATYAAHRVREMPQYYEPRSEYSDKPKVYVDSTKDDTESEDDVPSCYGGSED